MKKFLIILVFSFFFIMPIFAEDGEEAVILPNGESAYDYFGDGINDNIWIYHQSEAFSEKSDGVVVLPINEDAYLHQPYDYNAGSLKSSYYRFEVETYERIKNDNYLTTGGLMLVDDPYNLNSSRYSVSYIANLWLVNYTDSYRDDERFYHEETRHTLKFVTELWRRGDTNTFDITHTIYRDNNFYKRLTGVGTVNHIYPVVYASSNNKAKFKSFSAYSVPLSLDQVEWTQMDQVLNKLKLNWTIDTAKYDEVKIVYGSSENLNFDSDQVLFQGPSDERPDSLVIPSYEPFYIGIKGFGSQDTQANVVLFEPIQAVENFKYQYTSIENSYTFSWNINTNAEGYQMYDNGTFRWLSKNTNTITLSNVTNLNNVYLLAYKTSSLGSGTSYSVWVQPQLASIGAIQNLNYTQTDYSVNLTWDVLPGADYYTVYRDFGDNQFVTLATQLENPSYDTSTNNQNVVTRYQVKGYKDSIMSEASNIVEVTNKVKGLEGELVDDVQLSWQAIGDASSYAIKVSNASNMSNSITYTSSTNSYTYVPTIGDVQDKYIQVEAIKDSYHSLPSDTLVVDMSKNKKVENLQGLLNSTLNVVDLTWDELAEAVEYKVYKNDVYVETVTEEFYRYIILESDPDYLSFKIVGVGALSDFVPSDAFGLDTFTGDYVHNLNAVKDPLQDVVHLTWDSYFRAENYTVVIGDDELLIPSETATSMPNRYDYIIDEDDGLIKYFKVRANRGTSHSGYSAVVSTTANDAIDIEVSEGTGITGQYYDEPIETDITFEVHESALYNPVVEIQLNNVLYPSDATVAASFVYPEIGKISVTGYSGDLDYLIQVQSQGTTGFKVEIFFTTPHMESILTQGRSLVIPLKTGLNFSKVTGIKSILYQENGSLMTWMDLPFNIVEQLAILNSHVNFGTSGIEGLLNIQPTLKYDLNPGDKISTGIIPIEFINRRIIPVQD
ncbi:MAG: hypothetical protein JXR88_15595 [Clostridia bacterium]|nr:hypothetical protein [Clostridia bacterium]